MDPVLLRLFQGQVHLQCQFLTFAVEDLESAQKDLTLAVRDSESRQNGMIRMWFAIQNMLNAVGNISKALWGQGGGRSAERKPLRDSIGVTDMSPLRLPDMRNHFEHFDDRLDHWWDTSRRHNYVDLNVGLAVGGVEDDDTFRNYFPQTGEVVFWGERFDLRLIAEEVQRILPKLRQEAEKPPWVT